MIRYILGLLVLFSTTSNAEPRSLDTLLAEKEYSHACVQLGTIEHKTARDWYHLGLCQFEREQFGAAYAAWINAYLLGSGAVRSGALRQLYHMQEYHAEHIGSGSTLWHTLMGIEYYTDMVAIWLWQLLALTLLGVFLFMMVRLYGSLWVRIAVLIMWMLVLLPVITYYVQERLSIGLVAGDTCALYGGPEVAYPVVGELHNNDIVRVSRTRAPWALVRSADRSGWVQLRDVSIIR